MVLRIPGVKIARSVVTSRGSRLVWYGTREYQNKLGRNGGDTKMLDIPWRDLR